MHQTSESLAGGVAPARRRRAYWQRRAPVRVSAATSESEEPGSWTWVGRTAAAASLVLVAVALAWAFLHDDSYIVNTRFRAVSVLVKGNLVKVAGARAGTVDSIRLAPDGLAEVRLKLDPDFKPLRRGTRATIRAQSLSGSASRYVELHIPPAGGAPIADGGVIDATDTSTDVDLDEFFDLFDPKT